MAAAGHSTGLNTQKREHCPEVGVVILLLVMIIAVFLAQCISKALLS